jgi:hypothetical protein
MFPSNLNKESTEPTEQIKKGFPSWFKRVLIFAGICSLIMLLIGITGRWNLYLPFLFLLPPFAMILEGLRIIEMQLDFHNLRFWNRHPITGEQAIRRGRIKLVIGILLFLPCGYLAILNALRAL